MADLRSGLIIAAVVAAAAHATPEVEKGCRFAVPADLDAAPARWLGDCPNGAADGLGVLRAGSGEPYAFFAGRMQRGRPAEGLLMLREGGWMAAASFDPARRVVTSDGLNPAQDDRVFEQARAAALATAARFRQAGNRASADYYAGLARKIVEGRPE